MGSGNGGRLTRRLPFIANNGKQALRDEEENFHFHLLLLSGLPFEIPPTDYACRVFSSLDAAYLHPFLAWKSFYGEIESAAAAAVKDEEHTMAIKPTLLLHRG